MNKQSSKAARTALLIGLSFFLLARSAPGNGIALKSSTRPAEGRLQHPNETVMLNILVTGKDGQLLTGLDRSAFTVYVGKEPQEIVSFSTDDRPAGIGIIFDVSGSGIERRPEYFKEAKANLLRLMLRGHTQNEYFIIGFDNQPRLLTDWTRNGKALVTALDELDSTRSKRGGAAFYDALYMGIEKINLHPRAKRVIILITDGYDNGSRHTLGDVWQLLRGSDVAVYSIALFSGYHLSPVPSRTSSSVLEDLSSTSGGQSFHPDTPDQVREVFDRIDAELHHQYAIGFRSEYADAQWHRIKVKVKSPHGFPRLSVRTREGYLASAKPR